MSSHGYSTFFAFGSGSAAGIDHADVQRGVGLAGALLTVSTNGTNVRCFLRLHEEGLERHRDVGRRRLAGHHAVHELHDLLDFLLFLLAALLRSSFFVGAC